MKIVALRNLLAHNRGVVNARFLRQVADYHKKEGEEVHISADDFFETAAFISELTTAVDGRAVRHFALPVTD